MKPPKFILIVCYFFYAFSAESASDINFGKLDKSIVTNIYSFLSPPEGQIFSFTDKRIKSIFSRDGARGQYLRDQSRFRVMTTDGGKYFLEEYLSQHEKTGIAEVANVPILLQERPKDFVKLITKSIPFSLESVSINRDREHYYNNIIDVNSLIDLLPRHDTRYPRQKLTYILSELNIWQCITDQVLNHLEYLEPSNPELRIRIRQYVRNQFIFSPLAQTLDQITNSLSNQLSERTMSHLEQYIQYNAKKDISDLLSDTLGDKLRSQIVENLHRLKKARSNDDSLLDQTLQNETNYLLMIYHLASFAMRYNPEFQKIQNHYHEYLYGTISAEKTEIILENIDYPDHSQNYIIEAHLKIIRNELRWMNFFQI